MATAAVTPDNDAVLAEVFIAAPPERVFQAITDPQQMPLWWGQQGLYRVTEWKADVRPGGHWRSDGVGADGHTFNVQGRVSGGRPASPPGAHLDCELLPRVENGGSLGIGSSRCPQLAPCRTQKSRDRHVRENPPRWICRQCRTGEGPRRRLDPSARLDAGFCGRGKDNRHARSPWFRSERCCHPERS